MQTRDVKPGRYLTYGLPVVVLSVFGRGRNRQVKYRGERHPESRPIYKPIKTFALNSEPLP